MKKYITNFQKYKYLLATLINKDITLKYRRSYLGLLWTLLEPLLTTIVLTVVFGSLSNDKDRMLPVYILSGRLLYSFFSNSTKVAMKSIRTHRSMIKKIYVPKYIYPLSSVLSNYVIFSISLIILILLGTVLKVKLTLYIIQAIFPLMLLLIMSLGIGLILATLSVFFRDLEYLWSVILMLVMYTSAIFYKPEKIIEKHYGWILDINPLYSIIINFRNSIFGLPIDMKALLISVTFSVVSLLIGIFLFYHKQDKFILHI